VPTQPVRGAAYEPDDISGWATLLAGGLQMRYRHYPGHAGHKGQAWVVFPGFGQRYQAWGPALHLLQALGPCYWVEQPGHGASAVPGGGAPILPEKWAQWVQQLCAQENIERPYLLGYSLGGRLALASALALNTRVQRLVLCAAEGTGPSFWYSLATGSGVGRFLLQTLVNNPAWLSAATRLLVGTGILQKSMARFATSQLKTQAARKLVADSWLALRLLPGPVEKATSALVKTKTPVTVYAGQYDRVVPVARLHAFAGRVPGTQVHIVPVGHNALPVHVCAVLAKES